MDKIFILLLLILMMILVGFFSGQFIMALSLFPVFSFIMGFWLRLEQERRHEEKSNNTD